MQMHLSNINFVSVRFALQLVVAIGIIALASCAKPGPEKKILGSQDVARRPADTAVTTTGDTSSRQSATAIEKPTAEMAVDTIPIRSPAGDPARYGIESGRIVMTYRGTTAGTRILIFDRYGLRERKEEQTRPRSAG